MYSHRNIFQKEPAVIAGAAVATLALVLGFFVPITPEQLAGAISTLAGLLGLWYVRPSVTPVGKAEDEKDAAIIAAHAAGERGERRPPLG